jgi:hypothetical protein
MVVIAIVGLLIVCFGLIAMDVVSVLTGVALMVVGLFAIVGVMQRLDRGRQRGIHDPMRRLDANAGVVPTVMDQTGDGQPQTQAQIYAQTVVASQPRGPDSSS